MNRKTFAWIAGILIAGSALAYLFAPAPQEARTGSEPVRAINADDARLVARGKEVYATYCAACHGKKLEGQPDWRIRLPNGRLPAPPHDESGHTWHHPDAVLFDIVKFGLVPGRTAPEGYESDMPAYGGVLADQDIAAVIAYIKSTWPREARRAQEDVTRAQRER